MKFSKVILIFFLLSFVSCFDEYDDLVPALDSVPAGGVTGVKMISVVNDRLLLDVNIFAVDHFGNFIDNLSVEDFSITSDFGDQEFEVINITKQTDEFKGAYSASMLFDQSGSIQGTDPTDIRIVAGTDFAKLISNGDESAIAAFSDGGSYQSPYELLHEFSSNKDDLVLAIESLANRTGGGTPLYKSIFNLIPYTSENATNDNKAIIVFTDGQDTEGGITISDLVDRACSENVNVFTVGLSNGVDKSVLSQIAFQTGGAVMLAADALQLVSLYNSLGQLLRGQAQYYRVRLQARNSSRAYGPGSRISGVLNLNLSKKFPLVYPFEEILTFENSGNIDERLPSCNCFDTFDENLVEKWKSKAESFVPDYEDDPVIPNESITCSYVEVYNQNPEKFKWAGLAAIVSGIIGNSYKDDIILRNVSGLEFPTAIRNGNKAVYDDLLWQHLAYQEKGIEEIERIYCYGLTNNVETIPLSVYRAWLKIDQDDENNVWQGNLDLLKHEQKEILQDIIYEPFPIIWDWLEAFGYVESPVPEHDEKFPDSDIEIFDQRWKWLTESIIPKWRTYETNTNNNEALKEIYKAYCSECCNK